MTLKMFMKNQTLRLFKIDKIEIGTYEFIVL